ncbi:hypothetical protein CCAX7_22310 [Capsulimonas corticalis]|uniref:Uncharacterized protein n=1 Tax=Capsulimonas corticalis TaxID=2219043 RepID=A0A402D2B8_9BACT|nr:hypothetical protein [Capsulimonas corticalis]BDI30180.1 hypothetical protein CCAX7_22310 [Capsulimonas corticalis]
MNSQLNTPNPEDRIADYLDCVAKPMKAIPEEAKQPFLQEIKTHAQTLADQYRDEGRDDDAAVRDALRMIGDPAAMGKSWAKSWLRANEPGSFWGAFVIGTGMLTAIHIINYLIFLGMAPIRAGLVTGSPVSFWTALIFGFWYLWGQAAVVMAGAICGWRQPRRATAALLWTCALGALWELVGLCMNANALKTAMMAQHAGHSTAALLLFLARISILSLITTGGLCVLGSSISRSRRIRRLLRA